MVGGEPSKEQSCVVRAGEDSNHSFSSPQRTFPIKLGLDVCVLHPATTTTPRRSARMQIPRRTWKNSDPCSVVSSFVRIERAFYTASRTQLGECSMAPEG
jgi:hypothetical protein